MEIITSSHDDDDDNDTMSTRHRQRREYEVKLLGENDFLSSFFREKLILSSLELASVHNITLSFMTLLHRLILSHIYHDNDWRA